jgi:transcriptional regulator with PAS, ATPase and Fis domain
MFDVAHTGTIFLDQICELDLYNQASLLRVINEGNIIRKGDDRTLPVNVRVICSSNKNLMNLVIEGKFNEDLYYVLNVLSLRLTPLRDRKEDILVLLDYFVNEYNNKYKKYVVLTEEARAVMCAYPWYGNVLQFKNFCEKLIILASKKVLNENTISEYLELYNPSLNENKYDKIVFDKKIIVYGNPEAAKILELLDKHKGNREKVAEELNISKTTLWRKIKKYKIENKFNL